MQYVRAMEHYRQTSHNRSNIKFHLVWIAEYRRRLPREDVGVRPHQLVRTICAELEVEILKGPIRRRPDPPIHLVPAARFGELPDAVVQPPN